LGVFSVSFYNLCTLSPTHFTKRRYYSHINNAEP
jgi:hypothetical protein